MGISLFRGYLAAMFSFIALGFLTPAEGPIRPLWQASVGWAAAACMVLAARRSSLQPRPAWWLCAAGVALNATGIVVEYLGQRFFGYTENDAPVPADAFWLALYPALVVGLSIFAHRRTARRDWSTILDAAIVLVGVSLLSWVFIISASLHGGQKATVDILVVVAYPVGDLAVLGVLMRLLLQPSREPNVALRWVVAGLVLLLVGDLGWALVYRFGVVLSPLERTTLQSVFTAAFVSFGAAAMHPDAQRMTDPATGRTRAAVSLALLVLLASTSLIPSMLLLYQAWWGRVIDGVAIALSSALLFVLVVFRVTGLLRTVEQQALQLEKLSSTDELTGLLNRRAWKEEVRQAMENALRWRLPLCVALIDFDHFKAFNDSFGHQAGDRLLRDASQAWQQAVRGSDRLGRYGGEELILIMPNTQIPGAIVLLDRLRPLMPERQTFSSGLAQWDGLESFDALMLRIDQALYRAKEQGRNRTELANGHATAPEAAEMAAAG